MTYLFKCTQGECEKCNETVEITKPMADSSSEEFCEECKHPLERVFSSFGLKTANDGYKP